MIIIGDKMFSKDEFQTISNEFQTISDKHLISKEVNNKNGNRKSDDEENVKFKNTKLWKALTNMISENDIDKAMKNIGVKKYLDYIIYLVKKLHEDNGQSESFNNSNYSQSLRRKINNDAFIEFLKIDNSQANWVDLLSAINNQFGCFDDDIDSISENGQSFYQTKMAKFLFDLGLQEDTFLYSKNLKHLCIFCTIIKKKTVKWYKDFYENAKNSLNETTGDYRWTETLARDIIEALSEDDWENCLMQVIINNTISFIIDEESESDTILEKLREAIENEYSISETKGKRIEYCIDKEIEKNEHSMLYKKLFYVPSKNDNKENLLVFEGSNDFIEDISYFRKILCIILVEEYINIPLISTEKAIADIDSKLFALNVRPINQNENDYDKFTFDWYVRKRLECR